MAALINNGRIEYNKKPGKLATVKVVKDGSQVDSYKSGTIHTGSGEPPNSVSKPTPRGKQVAARPVTKGKLLRPGGPGGGPSKLASRPVPERRPIPQPTPQPAAAQPTPASRTVPQPVAAVAASHSRTSSTVSARAPPPPPPAPPAAAGPKKAKALYDFSSENNGMLSISAGQIVEIVSKEGNGQYIFPYY